MKYDIFISYKHTDYNGCLTDDCLIAQKLYEELIKSGYTVFFSSSTLAELGSSRYKADIDSALDNANAMVVILTKSEYALSQWVQYEWDSFYNDYLSGNRTSANLFTLTRGVDVHELPRTLRNVQNFIYSDDLTTVCNYIKNAIPKNIKTESGNLCNEEAERFTLLTGDQITEKEIMEELNIEGMVYAENVQVTLERCLILHKINPNVYYMVRDNNTGKIVGGMDIEPIDDDFYKKIKTGQVVDMDITPDVVLGYNMPRPYSVYFSSVIIDPKYRNTEVFFIMYNAVIKQFLELTKREIYIKKMIADAVTIEGTKFSRLFGMTKINESNHNSTLYEVSMIPPKFKILSKATKNLYDCYQQKYDEDPYLFDLDD